MTHRILAIVGSYRPGHTIGRVTAAVLTAARERGAQVELVQLREWHIEFCTNCPACTTGAMKSLAITAKTVGARPVGRLYIGLASLHETQDLPPRILARARRLGANLVP